MNRTVLISLLLMPWTMPSCGVEESSSHTNKVIGSNELTPVNDDKMNIPETLRELPDAIGLLGIGCTVTHIGDGLVLTAGHCIPQEKRISDECLAKVYPKMTIRWNYRSGTTEFAESNCLRIVSTELSSSHDFALLRVDNPPKASVRVELNERPDAGEQITVFAHPRKRPLEWSQFCTLAVLPKDHMTDLTPKDRKSIFAHQCDTEQGSSGAAIFSANSLKIIGVHHGGVEPWNTATWIPVTAISKAIRDARRNQPAP
jgi:V8-like Glu-specific endopeptidase